MISLREVDGREHADIIVHLNSLHDFPKLQDRHLDDGFWFLAYDGETVVGFAGLVENVPHHLEGYLKRCYVLPDYRGRGLQSRFLKIREDKARELGWANLVSDCRDTNFHSMNNFKRAGYQICDPEQPWEVRSVYFVKRL